MGALHSEKIYVISEEHNFYQFKVFKILLCQILLKFPSIVFLDLEENDFQKQQMPSQSALARAFEDINILLWWPVQQFIKSCVICQKVRIEQNNSLILEKKVPAELRMDLFHS